MEEEEDLPLLVVTSPTLCPLLPKKGAICSNTQLLISSGKTGEAEEGGGGAIGARRKEERGDKGHAQSEGKAPISLVALTADGRGKRRRKSNATEWHKVTTWIALKGFLLLSLAEFALWIDQCSGLIFVCDGRGNLANA